MVVASQTFGEAHGHDQVLPHTSVPEVQVGGSRVQRTGRQLLQTPVEESGLSQQENTRQAYEIFQNLILDAYGVKEADNVTFTKSAAIREAWSNHVAFVELIWEFIANPALATEFIEKCLPPKMVAATKAEMQREAEANGSRLSSETLSDMVEEAARRQEDPATRIEPGLDAAREALGENPAVEGLALATAESQSERIPTEMLTEQDIANMPQEEFDKLDVQNLSKPQMLAAFRRKNQG